MRSGFVENETLHIRQIIGALRGEIPTGSRESPISRSHLRKRRIGGPMPTPQKTTAVRRRTYFP